MVQYLCEGQKEHINKSVYAQIPIATPLNYSCRVSAVLVLSLIFFASQMAVLVDQGLY